MEIEDQKTQTNSEISLSDRIRIVSLKSQGKTGAEVSRLTGASKSACNSIFKKWKETGNIEDSKRSGRPKKTNEEENKMIIEVTSEHPEMSLEEIIEESKVEISKPTCWRILKSKDYCYRTCAEKWELDEIHEGNRLFWAEEYIKYPDEYWERLIFTDESVVINNPNKQKLWLPKDAEVPPTQSDRWQESVLIWGAMGFDGMFILEILNSTMDSEVYLGILRRRLLRNFPNLHPDKARSNGVDPLIYQHDGARAHVSLEVQTYFDERGIEVLGWPAKSPDINLMESVWAMLKSGLKKSYESRQELIEDIMESKKLITPHYIQNLYFSMRRRIQAIIDNNGGPTKY